MAGQRDLDIVVFGASGFTGKEVVRYLATATTAAGGGRVLPVREQYRIGVAGRRLDRLQAVLAECDVGEEEFVPVVADVRDEEQLVALARRTRVLLNCVGPFRLLGEPVVLACIGGGCHYLDVCGEPEFMEVMEFMHDHKAEEQSVVVVSGCGFDSIPADLGTIFAVGSLPEGVMPSTVESFLSISAAKGASAHYATYECIVRGLASAGQLRRLRKLRQDPRVPVIGQPLKRMLSPTFCPRFGAYALPFMGADASVVRRTQRELFESGTTAPLPTHYAAYFTIQSYWTVLKFMVYGSVFSLLAKFGWGRSLLLRFPGLFSAGCFSHEGPTREQMASTSFDMTFVTRGYLELPRGTEGPNCEVVTRVSGPEPGYVATPIALVQSACTLLADGASIPVGIHTPGTAFRNTSLISRLQRAGILFSVLETTTREVSDVAYAS